jgi:TBC1 domain family member 23
VHHGKRAARRWAVAASAATMVRARIHVSVCACVRAYVCVRVCAVSQCFDACPRARMPCPSASMHVPVVGHQRPRRCRRRSARLAAELGDPQCDAETLRTLCRSAGFVPPELRAQIWTHILGVHGKADPLRDWSGSLDLPEQDIIHADVQRALTAAAPPPATASAAEAAAVTMERVITYYCKARTIPYTSERRWASLIFPLVATHMPEGSVYNCLYAILNTYVPRQCSPQGPPFAFLRLLLQYHDPDIIVRLDSLRVSLEAFVAPWLRLLFSDSCALPVLSRIWDAYFVDTDPFLVFFLSLVIIINFRDTIMAAQARDELLALLPAVPSQLREEDVIDFVAIARFYSATTPPSFLKQFYPVLFSSAAALADDEDTEVLFCLTISARELLLFTRRRRSESQAAAGASADASSPANSAAAQSPIEYVIVDARPGIHWPRGSVFSAILVEPLLLLDSPAEFDRAWSQLVQLPNAQAHICLYGTGQEAEDQYMLMVIAHLLQQGVKHVSLVQGGWGELISTAVPGDLVPGEPAPRKSIQLAEELLGTAKGRDRTRQQHQQSQSQRQPSLSAAPPAAAGPSQSGSTWFKQKSQELKQDFVRMVYNEPLPMDAETRPDTRRTSSGDLGNQRKAGFSIDGAEEGDHRGGNQRVTKGPPAASIPKPVWSSVDVQQSLVDVESWASGLPQYRETFACNVVDGHGVMMSGRIVVAAVHMRILLMHPERPDHGLQVLEIPLTRIMRITQKKKHPTLVTFEFTVDDSALSSETTVSLRVVVPETQRFTALIRDELARAQPPPEN